MEEDDPQEWDEVAVYEERRTERKDKIGDEENPKSMREKYEVIDTLKRGLRNHSEEKALKKLKRLTSGKGVPEEKSNDSTDTTSIEELDGEKVFNLLFERFTFQGQVVLSTVFPKWNRLLGSLFETQLYLWFSNEDKDYRRFLPIDVCCQTCVGALASEPVIRVDNSFLLEAIDRILSLTPNLECLRLYRFAFNRMSIVKKIHDNCPQIKHLDLTECFALSLSAIQLLADCYPDLKHLILNSTDLDEEMLSVLAKKMQSLQTLVVSSTLISGQSLSSLPKCLRILDIRCCPKLSATAILEFGKSPQSMNLEHLKIDPYPDQRVYTNIGQNFGNSLELLELNEMITSIVRPDMSAIGSLNSLKVLRIGRNILLNDSLFTGIVSKCKQIESFSLEFNPSAPNSLTEPALVTLGEHWPRLKRLEIMSCTFVGQPFLQVLVKLKHLCYLNLTECIALEDQAMAEELKHWTEAVQLVLDKCHGLGVCTLNAVKDKAKEMANTLLRVSMIRCKLKNLGYLKAKDLPKNLRITYSSDSSKKYWTFDGQRTRFGNMADISDFLKGL